MKKHFTTLLLLFYAFAAQAQTEFAAVDSLARSIRKDGYPTPEALAKALCKNLKTDRDKARVLFTWVAENMRYDFKALDRESPKFDTQKEALDYKEKMILTSYRKGKGVCQDYARLYQKMAVAVGLECAYIGGHSKGSVKGGWASHAWNAVKVDGEWQLLDVTWGSGHTEDDGKFYQVFQPGFFFPPPRLLALDHFPDDEKWQLLAAPISKMDFKKQAAFSYGDPLRGITDTEPFGQHLTKGADGKVELRLKIQQPPSIIKLKMSGRELQFEQSEKDGWLILRFTPTNGRELQVWGGEHHRGGVLAMLMGVFPVD